MINREFISKMMEAKQLEKEAFLSILPENAKGHIEVIDKEIMAIFQECIIAGATRSCGFQGEASVKQGKDESTKQTKVRRVEII